MADGDIVLAVVVVFEGIGLMAVEDAVGCCCCCCCGANALSCEFSDSVGECTGAANAGVGIVEGKLRMKLFFQKSFVLFSSARSCLLCTLPLSVSLWACVLVFRKLSFFVCSFCCCLYFGSN